MSIPKSMDVVNLQIEPHVGHEIGGHNQLNHTEINKMSARELLNYYKIEDRPVLVVSKQEFNQFGMIECMPITTHNHMVDPFKSMMIKITTKLDRVHGYVAPFQLLGYDYIARRGAIIDRLDDRFRPEIDYYTKSIFFN